MCCDNNYVIIESDIASSVNKECLNLKYNVKFNKILSRIESTSKYTNHQYMSYSQLVDKISNYVIKLDEMRLNSLHKDFLIISFRNKISLYKRFNNLLANSDVERIRELMTICLNNQMGIRGIINKFLMAANDLYRLKQWNKEAIDLII